MNRRLALQALMLPLAACWRGSARMLSNTAARDPNDDRDLVDTRLRARVVTDDDFFRTVLYTWTTPRQIADLRASGRLLTATARSGSMVSPFNRSLPGLANSARPGATVARLLATHPALIRRRYAWTSAFATVLGLGTQTYGSALIRIVLRPDAWIGRYDPSATEPFRFIDASGAEIALDRVAAGPRRIAAIFHVRTEGVAVPFREYVVTNPEMVASWSVATDDIRAELARETSLLHAVRVDADGEPACTAWGRAPAANADTSTLWRATLAFDGSRYQPLPRRLAALAAGLDAYEPAGAPLVSS